MRKTRSVSEGSPGIGEQLGVPAAVTMRQARNGYLRGAKTHFDVAEHAIQRYVTQRVGRQAAAGSVKRRNAVTEGEQAQIVEQAAIQGGCDNLVLRQSGVGPVVGKYVGASHSKIVRLRSQGLDALNSITGRKAVQIQELDANTTEFDAT